jgi:peptidoglycan/LPS O-acetylase OafA/YrhL
MPASAEGRSSEFARARAGSSSKLAALDGMRGLAACYVMLGHARWLLWEGYSEGYLHHPDHYSSVGKLLVTMSAAFRWGHEAVIFFFVLSGFVIHLKYAQRLAAEGARGRFDPGGYAFRRARRLYPPLALAMFVTLVLDVLGKRLGLPTASGTTSYAMINANVGTDHRPITALRNLVFIMDPVFGSDGPLWSLGYEGYFYLLYPLVFLVARRAPRSATALVAAMSVVGFTPIWPPSLFWLRGVFQLMIVWWLGALLAARYVEAPPAAFARLRWLAVVLLLVPIKHGDPVLRDIAIGLGFVGLLSACLDQIERGRRPGWLATLERLRPVGAMSYTLYVLHFPILVFMSGCLMKRSGGPLPEHFGWAAAGVMLSMLLAYALHFAVERPFTTRRH